MAWKIGWLSQFGNDGAVNNAADAVEAPRRTRQDVERVLQRVAGSTATTQPDDSRPVASARAHVAARDPPCEVTDTLVVLARGDDI